MTRQDTKVEFFTFDQLTREGWGRKNFDDTPPSDEELIAGALIRIADALEAMLERRASKEGGKA